MRRKPLVCQHLEFISGSVLDKHQDVVREYVGRRHGIYALYRRDRLYYVGLAKNLRGRLRSHLKDRHAGLWDRFSVYLTIGDEHIKELESLALRITMPKGNRQRGGFAKAEDLKRRFKQQLKQRFMRDLADVFGRRERTSGQRVGKKTKRRSPHRRRVALADVLPRRAQLQARFKGKNYRAAARRDGRVRFRGKLYDSPSAAGEAVRSQPTNGWGFWKFERAPGDWVPLRELRGR